MGIGNEIIVDIGGTGGGNAGLILDNGAAGAFRAPAVDNLLTPTALPVGDVLSISYTLTIYAVPANIESFDLAKSTDLVGREGPLPANSLVGTAAIPEPASLSMMGPGAVGVLGYSAREGRRRRKAE